MNIASATLSIVAAFSLTGCVSKTEVMSLSYPAKEVEGASVLDKLTGTWKSEDGQSFERWTKDSDSTYRSEVYMLKGNDTVYTERASVFREKDRWIFENLVSGQNDGQKVRFTSGKEAGQDEIVFRNPLHDFPNEIHYTLPDDRTVHAYITGKNQNGGTDTIPFNYSRVK